MNPALGHERRLTTVDGHQQGGAAIPFGLADQRMSPVPRAISEVKHPMLVVLARVGLVASIASYLLLFLLIRFPVTWPRTRWYSTTGVIGLALSLVVVFTAYRIVIRALARPTRSQSRRE